MNISVLILPLVYSTYIHILEASMSNIYTALLNKDPTHPLTPKNSSARQPQCLMEPHFAAPVPPDMPLMVKWSAFPFTTPGNEMLRQRFPVLVGCKVGRKCPCFTCPNLVPFASSQWSNESKENTRPDYPSKVTVRLETSYEFLHDNNMIVGLLRDHHLQFHGSPHQAVGTWSDYPNADTCHQLHGDSRRGVGVLQVLHFSPPVEPENEPFGESPEVT